MMPLILIGIILIVVVGVAVAITVTTVAANNNNTSSQTTPSNIPNSGIGPIPIPNINRKATATDIANWLYQDTSELNPASRDAYFNLVNSMMIDETWDKCIGAFPIPLSKEGEGCLLDLTNLPSSFTYNPLKVATLRGAQGEFMLLGNEIRLTGSAGSIELSGVDISSQELTCLDIVDYTDLGSGTYDNGMMSTTENKQFGLLVNEEGTDTNAYVGGNVPLNHTSAAYTAPRLYTLTKTSTEAKLMIDSTTVQSKPNTDELIPLSNKYNWIGVYDIDNSASINTSNKTSRGLYLFKDLTSAEVDLVNASISTFMTEIGMMLPVTAYYDFMGDLFRHGNGYVSRNVQIALNQPSVRFEPSPRDVNYNAFYNTFTNVVEPSWRVNNKNFLVTQPVASDFFPYISANEISSNAGGELAGVIYKTSNKASAHPFNGNYICSTLLGDVTTLNLNTPNDYYIQLNYLYEGMKGYSNVIDLSDDNLYKPLSSYADEASYIAGCISILSNTEYYNSSAQLTFKGLEIVKDKISAYLIANPNTRVVPVYEEDTFNFFRSAEVITERDQIAYKNLITSMKSANVWSKGGNFYPIVATSDPTKSFVNLFNTSQSLGMGSNSGGGTDPRRYAVPAMNQFLTNDNSDNFGNYTAWGIANKNLDQYVGGISYFDMPTTDPMNGRYQYGVTDGTTYDAFRYHGNTGVNADFYFGGTSTAISPLSEVVNKNIVNINVEYENLVGNLVATNSTSYQNDTAWGPAESFNRTSANLAVLTAPPSWGACNNTTISGGWNPNTGGWQGMATFDYLTPAESQSVRDILPVWLNEMNRPCIENSKKYDDYLMFTGNSLTRLYYRGFSRGIALEKYSKEDTCFNMQNYGFGGYNWQNLIDAYTFTLGPAYTNAIADNPSAKTTTIAWEFSNDMAIRMLATKPTTKAATEVLCNVSLDKCAEWVTMAKASGYDNVKVCSMVARVVPALDVSTEMWAYCIQYINQALKDTPDTIYGDTYILEDTRFFLFQMPGETDAEYALRNEAMVSNTTYYNVDKVHFTDEGTQALGQLWGKLIYGML